MICDMSEDVYNAQEVELEQIWRGFNEGILGLTQIQEEGRN